MIGQISIGGVYLPGLLVLSAAALLGAALIARALSLVGAYRLLVYRPAVDISLFILLLGLLVRLTQNAGAQP
jgi:hypothetical protein